MLDLNYGVVEIAGRWTIIGQGLRFGSFATAAEAEAVARKMAEQAAGLPVQLHVQDAWGELIKTAPPNHA